MPSSTKQVAQYLSEAYATERTLTRMLQEQIAVTPSGRYRTALERHLRETEDHARRVRSRIDDLGGDGTSLVRSVAVGVMSLTGQAIGLAKAPFDLLRGSGGEEKVLKNAKDAAASEALEIGTYTALEEFARSVGDEETADLAADIRADEERMLDVILDEIPQLTGKVVSARVRGKGSYDVARTGAGEAAREAGDTAKRAAGRASTRAKRGAREARKVPGVARAEGEVRGAVASADELPIARYDELTADEIIGRLPGLSQVDLGKVHGYERRHEDRSTVIERVESLFGREPWAGYDEQNVPDIRAKLDDADDEQRRAVRAYERAHKSRQGVLDAAEASPARA